MMAACQRALEEHHRDTDHLHWLHHVATETGMEEEPHTTYPDHHNRLDGDADQEEQELGLEIVEEEDEEDSPVLHSQGALSRPSPSPHSPSGTGCTTSSPLPGGRREDDGTEEIVRNALFLLALKHPSLKQQPSFPTHDAHEKLAQPQPHLFPFLSHRPLRHSHNHNDDEDFEDDEDEGEARPAPTEADWKGREDMCPTPPAATTILLPSAQPTNLKRARREEAKRLYRDQRRQRRRERRRLHEQQRQPQPVPVALRLGTLPSVNAPVLTRSPSPTRPAASLAPHSPPPDELRCSAEASSQPTMQPPLAADPLPLSAAGPLPSDPSLPVPSSRCLPSPAHSRKRKRITRRHSDDGEAATSYDEDVDEDEEIDYDDDDENDDDDDDALVLCEEEEEILDSCGSSTAAGHSRKRKRPVERKRATADQVVILEKMYNEDKFPSSELIRQTGDRLGMKPSKVKNWFQNKRAKERRIAAGKERSKSKKAAAAAAAPAPVRKVARPTDGGKARAALTGKAKEAEDAPRLVTARHTRVPMEMTAETRPLRSSTTTTTAAEVFSSSLPFSFLSERRKLALPAPPKKRYALEHLQPPSSSSSSTPLHGSLGQQREEEPSRHMRFLLPPLVSSASSSSLHTLLSPPLPPTLPAAPHQCQRQ